MTRDGIHHNMSGHRDNSRQRITFGRLRSEANIDLGSQEQSDYSDQTKQF